MATLLRQLFIRYKLLHLLLLLLLSLLLLFLYDDPEMPFWPQWLAWLIAVACCAMAAQIVVNRLLPVLLHQKKTRAFLGYTALLALANSLLTYILAGGIYVVLTGDGPLFSDLPFFIYMVGFFYLANVVVIGIACLLRFTTDRARLEVRLAQSEQEKKSAELAFLRAQTNPHFLFNVLNTIYFQIRPDNLPARQSVGLLADILRYQLYECGTEMISLDREINNLRNYVALQTLRLELGTVVSFETGDNLHHLQIAPLLLLPLVENAFKHLSHHKNPADNQLTTHLYQEAGCIFVAAITNTYQERESTALLMESGGLGLQNVKRRLELLYPGKHELTYGGDGAVYSTKLTIAYEDSVFAGG